MDPAALSLTEVRDLLYTTQVEYGFPQELTAYHTSREWLDARSVLDAGTGNGCYLSRLAACFPEKDYLGIDISDEMAQIAARRHAQGAVRFQRGDLFSAQGTYDFLLMRFLLQHLADLPQALAAAARLTASGGGLLVIEADDPARFIRPELPELGALLDAYTMQEARHGRDRAAASRVVELAETDPAWRLARTLKLLIPSTLPGYLDVFRRAISLVILLIEKTGTLPYDYARGKAAWRRWCALDHGYCQAGLSLVLLRRE